MPPSAKRWITLFSAALLCVCAAAQESSKPVPPPPAESGLQERLHDLQQHVEQQEVLGLRRIEDVEQQIGALDQNINRILLIFGLSAALVLILVVSHQRAQNRLAAERLSRTTREAELLVNDIRRELSRPETEFLRISHFLRHQLRNFWDRTPSPHDIGRVQQFLQSPDLPVSLHCMALALVAAYEKRWESAVAALEQIREFDSDDPFVVFHLANVHAQIAGVVGSQQSKAQHAKLARQYYAEFAVFARLADLPADAMPPSPRVPSAIKSLSGDADVPTPIPPRHSSQTPLPDIIDKPIQNVTANPKITQEKPVPTKPKSPETKPTGPRLQPLPTPYSTSKAATSSSTIPKAEPSEQLKAVEQKTKTIKPAITSSTSSSNNIPKSKPVEQLQPTYKHSSDTISQPASVQTPTVVTPKPAFVPTPTAVNKPATTQTTLNKTSTTPPTAIAKPSITPETLKAVPTPPLKNIPAAKPTEVTTTLETLAKTATVQTPTADNKPDTTQTALDKTSTTPPASIAKPAVTTSETAKDEPTLLSKNIPEKSEETIAKPAPQTVADKMPSATTQPVQNDTTSTPRLNPLPTPESFSKKGEETTAKPNTTPVVTETSPTPVVAKTSPAPSSNGTSPVKPAEQLQTTSNIKKPDETIAKPAATSASTKTSPAPSSNGTSAVKPSEELQTNSKTAPDKKPSEAKQTASTNGAAKPDEQTDSKTPPKADVESSKPAKGDGAMNSLVNRTMSALRSATKNAKSKLPNGKTTVHASLDPETAMWDCIKKGDECMEESARFKSAWRQKRAIDRALTHYAKAQEYKTNDTLYFNWGIALVDKALHLPEKKRDIFYNAAIDRFLAGHAIAPKRFHFPLATLCAIAGHNNECRLWLKRSLESGTLDHESLLDAPDFEPIRAEPWFSDFMHSASKTKTETPTENTR